MRQQLCVKHLRQNPIRGDEILRRSFLVDSSFIKPQSWSIEKRHKDVSTKNSPCYNHMYRPTLQKKKHEAENL